MNDIFHTVADAAGIVWQPTKQSDPGFLKQMHKGIIKTKYFTIMSRKDFVDAGGEELFPLDQPDLFGVTDDRFVILDGNHRMQVYSDL